MTLDPQATAAKRGGKKIQFTHCDICGEPLPEEEIAMGTANHRGCWKKWVEEKRRREPAAETEGSDVEPDNDLLEPTEDL